MNDAPVARTRPSVERWLSPSAAPAARYGAALGFLALIVALQRLARPHMSPAPFMGAYAAVVFASWFCGLGPSLAVIGLSIVSAVYLFLEPYDTFEMVASSQLVVVAGFVLTSTLITALGVRAGKAYRRLGTLSTDLANSEERWRLLAEAIPQIVWTADANGDVDYQNGKWLEFTGRSIPEARRLGWTGTIHPDDVERMMSRWREALQSAAVFEAEMRLKRASDGSWRWFLSRGVPMKDAEGRVLKWFGTSTDIDDQKRSSETARFLADASEHLTSSLDYELTLQRVAHAAVPYFADWATIDVLAKDGSIQRVALAHTDPAKVTLARELQRKYPPNPDDPVGVPNVLRTGKSELQPEIPDELLVKVIPDPELLRIIRELSLKSSLTVPISARGKTLGALSFVMAESGRSYTPRDLALAEELGRRAGIALDNARLYEEVQATSRIKDEFLSTLSHELRTPLTAIVGWAHILAGGPDTERVKRGAGIIQRNALAQAQLIDDLLDVSRIVTGKMRLDVRPFQPAQVIEAAVEAVRPSAEAKGLRVETALDPAAGPIMGDASRVQQIVWNLLSNAVKFTPRDGTVKVSLARRGAQVEIQVSDTGIGITADFLPRMFERFTQADAGPSRAYGGLGLGMSIARHLTELHGGTIEARSDGRDRGSTFLVSLPVAAAGVAEAVREVRRPPPPESRLAAPDAQALQGASVVVVEDTEDAREMIRDLLERAGARVRTADSASAARELIAAEPPELLISDVGMAGEDGYMLIRSLRDKGLRFPAIALTAYARNEDRTRALVEGFDFHLPKPLNPDELLAIAGALRKRHG